MKKAPKVETEASCVLKEALLKSHGGRTFLSQMHIIIPIRPEEAKTSPKRACSILRWFKGN